MSDKSVMKNTLYNAIKTVMAILFPLITYPYITRVLLAENVGKIGFGMSVVSYFSLISNLGIQTYAIRACAEVRDDKEKLDNTASQIFTINVLTTIIAYCALGLTLLFYRKLDNYRLLIVIQSLSIAASTLGADWLNSAMEDFRYITIRTVFFQIVSIVLLLIFVNGPSDYINYSFIFLLSSSGASIINIWYRKRYCNVTLLLNFKKDIEWKKHVTPVLFLFVMLLAQNIFNNVDVTMLGLFHGDREVGIYCTAHKILSVINQLVGSIIWVVMPRMSYYFSNNDFDSINYLLRKILGLNFLIGLPCVIGITMLSKDIIMLISGVDFFDAAPVLQILMLGFTFTLVGGNFLGNIILLPSHQEKFYMFICCITAIINVVLNFIFIPKYGALAAAGTTSFCSFVIFLILLMKKDERIDLRKMLNTVVGPLIGCFLIVCVCLLFSKVTFFGVRIICSMFFSFIAYIGAQFFLKNDICNEFILLLKNKIKTNF